MQVTQTDSRDISVTSDRVVIVANDIEFAQDVSSILKESNKDVRICKFDGRRILQAPRQSPDAVLLLFKRPVKNASKIISLLKTRYANRDPVFIGAFHENGGCSDGDIDSVICLPSHPKLISKRVNSMLRLQKMQREIFLRMETLKNEFGIEHTLQALDQHASFKVLFIGEASPEFMVIINALEDSNTEVVAAFTSFSAFDYLHETDFDAVIMNVKNGAEPALTIAETMRKNARLYHTPVILLTPTSYSQQGDAYNKGVSDVIPITYSGQEISRRVLELANYYRTHRQLKEQFGALGGERCSDKTSNVYNRAFFEAHLRRISEAHEAEGRPTTMAVLTVTCETNAPKDNMKLSMAYNRTGRIIKNIVRMEDVVARLSENCYAVAFPGQSLTSVRPAFERIRQMISNTVFDSGEVSKRTFKLELDIQELELKTPSYSLDQLVNTNQLSSNRLAV